ncbi:MAG: M4 family metallopeptidase [Acidobacteria bacterium]|nr:M4 family metallopeptidase [Acidobacteriota bacterium]
MRRSRAAQAALLTFLLAGGSAAAPLVAQAAKAANPLQASARALEPHRVALAKDHAMVLRSQFGLGEPDAFVTRLSFTNTQGQAIVRLDQTHQGFRVFGGQALIHVLPDGTLRTLTQGVQPGVKVEGEPRLSKQGAVAIALRHLAPQGPMTDAPKVERVVFPAKFAGGLAFTQDPVTGKQVLDRKRLVHIQPEQPFVWAYEVRTRVHNRVDAPSELTYLIDGRSGEILRVDNALHTARASAPAQAKAPFAAPATGNGLGFYRGAVTLATTEMNDGTFSLWDNTRGTVGNPQLSGFGDDGSGWAPTGLQVWYASHDASGQMDWNMWLFQGNAANSWGDGQVWNRVPGTENSANGQTAAVDALAAMTTTWDFYANVFGRNGMDGNDTAVFAQVHMNGGYMEWYTDNASWSSWAQGMSLGQGSYPGNPKGLLELTDLDIIAHEMAHGVTDATARFVNAAGLEEAGMAEGTSDILAQGVRAYATRGAGDPGNAIPATGADWKIGENAGHGTPIRWMDKPSRDGRSADAWYDGLRYLDGHFSCGPLNRMFYLLSEGASATQGATNHSPYYPAGFTGIGLDAASRIWFKAVTENIVSDGTGSLTFETAREAALLAATDLYGAGHANVLAVEKAFSAINVGLANGQAPRAQVAFKDWREGDYVEISHFSGWSNKEFFPQGETVRPRVKVENTANTQVAWTIGGPSMYNGAESMVGKGGRINADGSWTTPMEKGWWAITATSQADATQFAEGRAFTINLDADQDLEQDAVDMGTLAFSWYLSNGLSLAHSVFNAPWVDDGDVGAFVDAVKNSWLPK